METKNIITTGIIIIVNIRTIIIVREGASKMMEKIMNFKEQFKEEVIAIINIAKSVITMITTTKMIEFTRIIMAAGVEVVEEEASTEREKI